MRKFYVAAIMILCFAPAYAQTFSAPVGIATVVTPGVYNLTPASICGSPYHEGAIWCTTTLDFTTSFVLTFQANFDHAVGSGADGIDVVFGQNINPASINGNSAYLGYYNPSGGPVNPDFNNSFGVEFDIFDNSYNPYLDDLPGIDHTAICANAFPTIPMLGPIPISPSAVSVKDGLYHDYKITWCPVTHTLQVFFNDTLRLSSIYNYQALFTTPSAVHWGFTGGTGLDCSNQLLRNILVTSGTCTAGPCLVTSLQINTGYDPLTLLAIPGGANGATPVTDPKWTLSAVTPGVATGIAATPLPGLVEVLPGANADVVTSAGWAASNPTAYPGGWISCLNSNYYVTDGTGVTTYNMTLGRRFHLCSADSIKLDCYVANDNYIQSTNIDGAPLAFAQPPTILGTNFNSFTHFSQTVYLAAGYHTLNIVVDDSNVSTPGANPTGLDLYGTVSSATGTASIVSEASPTCSCTAPVLTCDSLTMPDTLHLCRNAVIAMPATLTGGDSVLKIAWSPATGLSDTSILHPTLTAATSGWYHLSVTSLIPYNLVVNGDFSAGNTGFTSAYTFVSGPGSLVPAGVYAISTNPHNEHPGAASFYDHTTGTGNMLAMNGASTPINVWCQTITVSPNTWYDFSAWFANWSSDTATNLPIIQFEINGILVGTPFNFPHPDGLWTQFTTLWYSGTSTTANICINDQQTAGFGNDFAIDDITFNELCIATDSTYIALTLPDTTSKTTDTSICLAQGGIQLSAPAAGNWTWNTGSTSQTIVADSTGTYWVSMTGGCDSLQTDTFIVSLKPLPVVKLRADTTICAGAQITLGSPEPQGVTYLWSTGSTDSSIMVSGTGMYILTVTNGGCHSADTMLLHGIDAPAPVNLGPDTALCLGEELTLNANADDGLWSTGKSGKNIIVSLSGTYWYTVSNQCGSATDSIHIDIEPCDIWFPDAFTPNNDGLNDIARVGGNLKFFKGFSLSIYNRWGQRVFYTEDIYAGWNGEFNGVKQELGTYFYMINYTLQNQRHMLKGDLELIR